MPFKPPTLTIPFQDPIAVDAFDANQVGTTSTGVVTMTLDKVVNNGATTPATMPTEGICMPDYTDATKFEIARYDTLNVGAKTIRLVERGLFGTYAGAHTNAKVRMNMSTALLDELLRLHYWSPARYAWEVLPSDFTVGAETARMLVQPSYVEGTDVFQPLGLMTGATNTVSYGSDGLFISHLSGADTNVYGLQYMSGGRMKTLTPFLYGGRVKTVGAGDIADVRFCFGLADSTPSSADSWTAKKAVGFRFSTSAGDTKFQAITSDGSSANVQDTGVTVATATLYDLRIDVSDATSIKFYINGVLVATSTTNLPATSELLHPFSGWTNLAASAKTWKFGRHYCQLGAAV